MTANTELPGHFINRRGFINVDRRTNQRNPTFKFGVISCDPDRRILSVVKNISSTGALVELDNAVEIPDKLFGMLVGGTGHHGQGAGKTRCPNG